MQTYAAFWNPKLTGIAHATCEGGAGWYRGKWRAEMTVGGWKAYRKAFESGAKFLPPVNPELAEKYWSFVEPGEVALSNFYEDRFDLYHAKQLCIAIEPAYARGIKLAHYGLPSFDPPASTDRFMGLIAGCISITAPALYADDKDNVRTWSATYLKRMDRQIRQSEGYAKQYGLETGFCISPFTHQGTPLRPDKFAWQVSHLSSRVQHLFVWTDQPKHAATIAACGAVQAIAKVEMQS